MSGCTVTRSESALGGAGRNGPARALAVPLRRAAACAGQAAGVWRLLLALLRREVPTAPGKTLASALASLPSQGASSTGAGRCP